MAADEVSLAAYNGFIAEGGTFEQSGNFDKAVACYTKALDAVSIGGVMQEPIGIHCLCSRSKCYLKLGDHSAALADAEAALVDDPNFIKGLFAKAEALYAQGEFEFALVFYHRGAHMRPDMKSFRLGVQKAQEAISNAIGSTQRCQLTTDGDLTIFYDYIQSQEAAAAAANNKRGKGSKKSNAPPQRRRKGTAKAKKTGGSDSNVKHLLGELYADKAYLESLMNDPALGLGQNKSVKQLAETGVKYLDKRTEFWRQQKPMYVRKNEAKNLKSSARGKQARPNANMADKAAKLIEHAETLIEDEDFPLALQKAETAIDATRKVDGDAQVVMMARAQNAYGQACLALDKLDEAKEAFTQAVDLSRDRGDDKLISKSLSLLGQLHVSMDAFSSAIQCWEKASALMDDGLELAWLYHEKGRAELAQENWQEACNNGIKAREYAEKEDDNEWQLNSNLLIAQAQDKLGSPEDALAAYEQAAAFALKVDNSAVHDAIRHAILKIEDVEVVEVENEGGDSAV